MVQAPEWARAGYARVRDEWPPNPLQAGGFGDANPAHAAADTAAIVACLAKGGVTLPARHTFTLSDKLSVNGINEVVIRGDGDSSKLVLAAGVNKNALRINDQADPAVIVDKVLLKDFVIDHQGPQQAIQGGGIEGALVVWNTRKVIVRNVAVDNPLTTGFDIRGCQYVRIHDPFVTNLIHSGLAGNAINVGATSQLAGADYVVHGAEIKGGGDVAIWLSGAGAKRLAAEKCIVRGDTQRLVTDAEVVAGSLNILHSDTASFAAADIGKLVYLITAAGVRTGPFRISAIVDAAHATLSSNAAAMVGATAAIGIQNSGVICEGGPGVDTSYVEQIANQVESTWNVGCGFTDAGQTTLAHHESIAALNEITNAQPGSTAMWLTGRNLKAVENLIYLFKGQGLVLGQSVDFDQYNLNARGNDIEAHATATGAGIRANQTGGFANFLRDLGIAFNTVIGNGGGTYGIQLLGKLKDVELPGNKISGWKLSGLVTDVNGAASPIGVRVRGGYSKNNNQGNNGNNVNGAGYAFNAGSDLELTQARAGDDQGAKTQEAGIFQAAGATPLVMKDNDLRGNKTAPTNIVLGANDVYEDNREQTAAYQGTATLVAGTVLVNTAAVTSSSRIELTHRTFTNPGALFISARVNNTSFTITSTNAADASQINWRIR